MAAVADAMTVIRPPSDVVRPIHGLPTSSPASRFKVAAVALANKNARTAWALLHHGGTYRRPATVTA